jgi:DNA-binding winged helix-turn-helix (wHTH) protein/Flp pilus assembly protein TadD
MSIDATVLRFGPFVWQPGKGVFLNGENIPLPPKETAVLEALLGAHGKVASHREIEAFAWPNQYVSYSSLARCISSLRRRLKNGGVPVIESVPRRGYRLAVAVQRLSASEQSSLQAIAQTTPLAFSHFQAGVTEASSPRHESLARAVEFFQAAVAEDPTYWAAWSSLADARVYQILRGFLPPEAGLSAVAGVCEPVLEINPSFPPALAVMGWARGVLEGDLTTGQLLLAQAEAADPEYARQFAYHSWLHRAEGDVQAARKSVQRAVRLDPHNLLSRHTLSWVLFQCGRPEESLANASKLARQYPQDDVAQGYLSAVAAYLGKADIAIPAGERALALSGDIPSVCAFVAYSFAACGREHEARELLVKASVDSAQVRCPEAMLAAARLALGERDQAVDLLQHGVSKRCPWALIARVDPRLAPLFASGAVEYPNA